MKEMENNAQMYEDDEISLLDLFSVLVKHRFLICFGTLLAALLAALNFIVLPATRNPVSKVRKATIQYSYTMNTLPDAIDRAFTSGLEREKNIKNVVAGICEYNLNNLPFLASEIKAYNPFGSSEAELASYEYNDFIQSYIQNKKYEVKISVLESNLDVTINVPSNRINETNQMMDDIISRTNSDIEAYVFPKLDALEQSVPEALSTIQSGDNSLIAFQMIEENKAYIQSFRKSYKTFIEKKGQPFIITGDTKRNSLKKFIIVVFAVFFILVFIAFLINAVENIKQDPEARDKIVSAWNDGKIIKKK